MPTYLYCLTRAGAEPAPALLGLDGAPVRVVDAGGLGAWVSDVDVPPPVTVERARAHDGVIRAAMEQGTPLPARYGQLLASDAALRQELEDRAASVRLALERVDGSVEMTLRLGLGESYVPKSFEVNQLSGREYLERLREAERSDEGRRRRAEFLQRRVAGAVAGVVRGEVVSTGARDRATLVISHLVPREQVAAYRRAVRDAVRAIVEQESSSTDAPASVPVMISGPWAPYSFAELARG
ncbi:MAG TPA: GvpL/GvpF family gas vesicle protein [Gemmatimonadaceae bacterium]|jgi:hypothetical protein|nr:GvpL/GvpF family gas vesicle protein [Gemmatimonadaceae bacterium]